MHGFRDSVTVRKLCDNSKDMKKIAKQFVMVVAYITKAVYNSSISLKNVFNLIFICKPTFNRRKKCFSTLLAVILQLFMKNESYG